MTDDPSRRIGDYEILGVLGAGGMGKVFKVRNVISDRVEAMKVLLPDLAGRQELADRFLREIKLLAGLDHPNIAQLRTALTLSNRLVMVMEFVEGTTISERLEKGPIPPAEAIGYVTQVLNALAYAHGRNVIHRDIKPANMMVTPSGTVKLMDFGIARASNDASMTVTGTTVGSLYYMSPEQVKGQGVDARSDLYSLGVSLYEMVTGQRPFRAESDYSLMTAQLQERPKPPSELLPGLPPQLNGIILHAMAKEPGERFQSAEEFRKPLDALRQSLPASAAQPIPVATVPSVSVAPTAPSAVPSGTAPTVPMPFPAAAATPPPNENSPSFTPVPTQPLFTPVAAPQPTPGVMAMSSAPSKGRGLYITLGAVIVLVVLVLAGISLPRLLKTRAAGQSGQSQDQTSQGSSGQSSSGQSGQTSSDQSAAGQSGSQAGSADANNGSGSNSGTQSQSDTSAQGSGNSTGSSSTGNSDNSAKSKSKNGKSKNSGSSASSGSDQGNTTSTDNANSDAPQAEPYEAVEQDVDETSSRAVSYNQSLDSMKNSLSSQGLNLRGDIASAQELMKTNLERAQQALNARDTKNARRYLTMAQAQMDKIQKFLGH